MEIEESCPDIEVILNIYRKNAYIRSLEMNINTKCLVLEFKQWLCQRLNIELNHLRIEFDKTELEDNKKILTYEIQSDDELTLIDESP